MMVSYIQNNQYAQALYDKPEREKKGPFGWISYKIKERKYFKSTIKPIVDKWKKEYPTFEELCEFSDFIRILEMTFFYNNNVRSSYDTYPKHDKIMSDNPINGSGSTKNIILELQEDNACVIFTMFEAIDNDIIVTKNVTIKVQYYGAKKLNVSFNIRNGDIKFDCMNEWVLVKNMQDRCRNAMIALFLEYYKKL